MKFVLRCYACCQNDILHFKDRNLVQILHVDKTCFLRPSHICIIAMAIAITFYVAISLSTVVLIVEILI